MSNKGPVKYNPVGFDDTTAVVNDDDDCPNDKVKEELMENSNEYLENIRNSTEITYKLSEFSKQKILNILEQINSLTHLERFLIFLKLNDQISNTGDPLKQPLNPLGSRSEVCRTISWIKTHLEEDPEISLPKQQVYDEYSLYCSKIQMKPLSQADFGKVMKQVYPKVKARRLGTRGNSRYCYSGLRNCTKLEIPSLPTFEDCSSSEIQFALSQDEKKPLTQLSLTRAAWLIVKEWSENQLNSCFPTIQALAFFLVVNCSVGIGSEAATQLTLMSSSELTDDSCDIVKSEPTHRDVQIQLQKKLLSKDDTTVKERKRKIQSKSKNFGAKKGRSTANNNEFQNVQTSGETSQSESSASSNNTSPIEGSKPICDKYQDYNHKSATLPEFNCFQKPETSDKDKSVKVGVTETATENGDNIVGAGANGVKYKTVQPKPLYQLQCDNLMYNPLIETTGPRSQNSDFNLSDKRKKDVDEFHTELPLSRERLNSISNVDKDAMDDYLDKNNSQHEEELSRYFGGETEIDDTSKISQLRQLLQENGLVKTGSSAVSNAAVTAINQQLMDNTSTIINDYPILQKYIPIASGNARRRVSFDVMQPSYDVDGGVVPPSPNTRRKNFSFTPISPGPNSPGGRQSKCSSTSVSPFVSPRNTPVPKGRNYQNPGLTLQILPNVRKIQQQIGKIKKETVDLSSDILDKEMPKNYNNNNSNNLAMSAPVSPLLTTSSGNIGGPVGKSMLQTLLNTNGKVSYTPNYIATTNQIDMNAVSSPHCGGSGGVAAFNRSQSVPIDKNQFLFENDIFSSLSQDDFNELDNIDENEKIGVTNIINSLSGNDEIFNNNNNIILHCTSGGARNNFRTQNNNNGIEMVSRSVPSTPLSFLQTTTITTLNNVGNSIDKSSIILNNNNNNINSHSYPSTPLMSDEIFTYNMNDCLISGQPIKSNELSNVPQTNDTTASHHQIFDETSNFVNFDHLDDNNDVGNSTVVVADMNFNISIN